MNSSPSSRSTPSGLRWLLATVVLAVLAGCASPTQRAPVEERMPSTARPGAPVTPVVVGAASASPAVEVAPAKPALPGSENAGKPGYYTVKPGDTLVRVALENGQNWHDVARWNNIDNPNIIEVGQVLRVAPPGVDVGAASARPVASAGRVEARPLEGKPPALTASGAVTAASAPVPAPASAPAAAVSRDPEENLNWAWPAAGPVVTPFDDNKSKGLSIAGKAGDPVLAAADGRVVYAGAGLRGYGNLIIVKHNATYLTAYAHNQTLLVKEDQVVRRGQKIAEMGSSDAERVQLHFEIRRLGKPIDPVRLLPSR